MIASLPVPDAFDLVAPRFTPPLDPGFRPAVLANHAYLRAVDESGVGVPLQLALIRPGGAVSRLETRTFPPHHPRAAANLFYAERLLKFLLWQRGAYEVRVAGAPGIAAHLARVYAPGGARTFDHQFLGEQIYRRPFLIVACQPGDLPEQREARRPLGGHHDGCRIGFDLGASDLKVAALMDGDVVYSDEIVWEPREQTDPGYHYGAIVSAIRTAAAHLPRVDAIGGSAAGVYVDNRPMVASLFRGIPNDRYDEVRNLFLRIGAELGVPLEVVNDGVVTALAGSMALDDGGVLGIALGSSQAGGYVALDGSIPGWLDELAFCPVDYNPTVPVEEWSGDRGCGALYFSQQCVFRLAPQVGIHLPGDVTDAQRLEIVQEQLEAGHPGARQIWETIGVYMGYAIAHYADYYDLQHVLILGRCTSGSGGRIILSGARQVLSAEFPAVQSGVNIQLPDEKTRRVGQSIAAASLPALRGGTS